MTRVGKTVGQGLLYTDWKCFENSSTTSLGLIKCLPVAGLYTQRYTGHSSEVGAQAQEVHTPWALKQ
jgi:hypothetical protein